MVIGNRSKRSSNSQPSYHGNR